MKKVGKQIVAIAAAVSMMSALLAGCGDNTQTNEASKSSEPKQSEAVKESASSVPEASEPVVEEFTYPMEGNPVLDVLGACPAQVKNVYGERDLNLTEWASEVRKRTGVDVQWQHLAVNDTTSLSLLITDGKYPSVLEGMVSLYPGGAQAAIADGVVVPIDDLIDQYMPNLKALMEEYPIIKAQLTQADGHIYNIPAINMSEETGTNATGLIIRADWLEECGLEMPDTIPELHDVLVAFKEKYGATMISQTNLITTGNFANAFCPSPGSTWGVDRENGEIYYIKTSDGYREFLSVVAQWYDEGLIHGDFLTFNAATVRAKALSGENGCFWGYGGSTMTTLYQEADAAGIEIQLEGVPALAKEEGAEIYYNSNGDHISVSDGAYITDRCPEELYEVAARYYDYLYSRDGIDLGNYGIEGLTFEYVDGVQKYTDELLNNPKGYAVLDAMCMYSRNHSGGYVGVQEVNYLYNYYSKYPAVTKALKSWSFSAEDAEPYVVTNFSSFYSEAEAEEANTISTDLNTYVDEMRAKFVYGEVDVNDDTAWNEYVKRCEELKVNELKALVESAVAKKNERYASFGVK